MSHDRVKANLKNFNLVVLFCNQTFSTSLLSCKCLFGSLNPLTGFFTSSSKLKIGSTILVNVVSGFQEENPKAPVNRFAQLVLCFSPNFSYTSWINSNFPTGPNSKRNRFSGMRGEKAVSESHLPRYSGEENKVNPIWKPFLKLR